MDSAKESMSSEGVSNATSGFKYQPLTKTDAVRLLLLSPGDFEDPILCDLQHVELSENPVFEALSYAWGDPEDTIAIKVSGDNIQVTRSAFGALQYLRYPSESRILWIDAICINQEDVQEKSMQVSQMGRIFKHAEKVLIWLGEEQEEDARAFDDITLVHSKLISEINAGGDSSETPEQFPLSEDAQFGFAMGFDWVPIIYLFSRSWFRRKWVIQEVVHSQKAEVHCGTRSIPWSHLGEVARFLVTTPHSTVIESSPAANGRPARRGITNAMFTFCFEATPTTHANLIKLVLESRGFQCTDERDHLYCLYSLLDGLALHPNYNLATETIYRSFAQWAINQGHAFGLLDLAGLVIKVEEDQGACYPSWLPDLSQTSHIHAPLPDSYLTHSSRSTSQVSLSKDQQVLIIKGRIIDRVEDTVLDLLSKQCEDWNNLYAEGISPETFQAGVHEVAQEWFKECVALAARTNNDHQAFGRTFVCGLRFDASRVDAEYDAQFRTYRAFLEGSDTSEGDLPENEQRESAYDVNAVDAAVMRFSTTRRFCVTSEGRLGQAHWKAQRGDVIAIFRGAPFPYLLRPCAEFGGSYTFIGDCYVHGMMDGEAWELDGIEDEDIQIR